MKKNIILLIISLLFITGCYDNVELNKLSIISGLGIDYQDNNYIITYEVLNDNKSDNTGDLISDTINGKGPTISEAFSDANNKTSKKDFFAHLKLVILSEDLIKNNFKDITDYFIRDTDIRDEFFLVVANNVTPEEILKHTDKLHPVASEYIVKLLKNEKYSNSLPTKEIYQKILAKLISNKTDIVLNSITIKDNHLSLSNSYMFKGYNMYSILTMRNSELYNLLNFNNNGIEYINYYDNKVFAISVSNVKNDIKIDKDTISINSKIEAKILENNSGLDLKDTNIYDKLNSDFSKLLEKDIYSFIKLLQDSECDVLGLQDKYYKTYNKDNKGLWKKAKINVGVQLKINYKGYIYEVTKSE